MRKNFNPSDTQEQEMNNEHDDEEREIVDTD